MRLRTSFALCAATGSALVASLLAGCDDEPPTRHADFSDSPSTRFSEYRGPYGPYYIRPGQRRVVETPPSDPALAIPSSSSDTTSLADSGEDPLLDGSDALRGERYGSELVNRKMGMDNGFSRERHKLKPSIVIATPYSMATPVPTPSVRRLRPFLPSAIPSSAVTAAGHPDAAEKRQQLEEQTRRALLLSQPDSPLAPPTASPTPSAASPLPGSTPAPSTP